MVVLLSRPILLLSMIGLCCIAVIRAQPYDDSALRALLTPADCVAPCFMGIQPGISTSADALTILMQLDETHSVRSELNYSRPELTELIYWEWDRLDSIWFDPTVRGEIHIDNNHVRWIGVASRAKLGDIWQILGPPQTSSLVFNPWSERGLVFYEGIYPNQRLRLTFFITCPPRNFWQETASFTWANLPVDLTVPLADDLVRQVHTKCRQ